MHDHRFIVSRDLLTFSFFAVRFHDHSDYEGFDFSDYCNGPYAEYPLKTSSSGYTGGSPGADRVVYDSDDGTFCGAITHTGASGTNFVQCNY